MASYLAVGSSRPRASWSLDVNYRTKEGEKDGAMGGVCGAVVDRQSPCSLVVRRRRCVPGARVTVWCGRGGDGLAAPVQPYDAEEQVMGRVPVQPCGAEEVVMTRAYHHERSGERWRDGRDRRHGGELTTPMQPCDAEEAVMGQGGDDCAAVRCYITLTGVDIVDRIINSSCTRCT
jgi:hypothetical protein